jgi:hypothetical protein
MVTPAPAEVKEIFKRAPSAKALRYLSPPSGSGRESFLWTCRRPYGLETIDSKARNKVRQGLRNCQVRRITFEELEILGEQANSDSMKRFGIEGGRLKFGDLMRSSSAYEAWGSFINEQLAAYLITLRIEDWAYIQVQRSSNAFLKYRPNNALIYTVIKELLSRPEISTVSYGWEPLYDLDSLDNFKRAMGSVKEACRQSVLLAPRLRWVAPKIVCRLIETVSGLFKRNRRLSQAAGVCRIIRESSVI